MGTTDKIINSAQQRHREGRGNSRGSFSVLVLLLPRPSPYLGSPCQEKTNSLHKRFVFFLLPFTTSKDRIITIAVISTKFKRQLVAAPVTHQDQGRLHPPLSAFRGPENLRSRTVSKVNDRPRGSYVQPIRSLQHGQQYPSGSGLHP